MQPVRSLLAGTALVLAGLLLVALPAWARGGRYASQPGPRAPAAAEPAPPPAAEPAENAATPAATPVVPPGASAPSHAGAVGLPNGTARGRRVGLPAHGIVDWVHWYEVNRERFENIRARFLTDINPVFMVGGAQGPRVGDPTLRVGDAVREEILQNLKRAMTSDSGHWQVTQGAAYVALGKVAVSIEHLAPHFAALEDGSHAPRFIQESAVLGLGHLKRSDSERQISPSLLDRVREVLLNVLSGERYGIRTRAFAGIALGLLADQPTRHLAGANKWTAERLFRTWITTDLPDEVQVGLLLGLTELDRTHIPHVIPLVLEGCALRGRDWPRPPSALVRAHTVIALGHLGDARNAPAIRELLGESTHGTHLLRQAAAIAAAVLGEREVGARQMLGEALLDALEERGEPGRRHLAWIALGRILGAEIPRADTYLLTKKKAGERLLACAREGTPDERSFAALALALSTSAIDHSVDSGTWQAYRFDALEVLRGGVANRKADIHTRSAFCVALGLTKDRQHGDALLSLLSDADQSPELRAYAGLALGLMGDARPGVVPALTRALAEPRSELLRMRSATAIGLLGGGGNEQREAALRILMLALKTTRSQAAKGQIAVTLGRLGDARVVEPLSQIVRGGGGESHLNRAMACAALGLVGTEELRPTLAALRERCHYLAGSDVVFQVLDLL